MEDPTQVEPKTVEHSIPLDILSDLLSRFIINVPEAAKENHIRLCFQIELAYWYYLDFYVDSNSELKLKPCSFKEFASHVFQHLPYLQCHYDRLTEILDEWKKYKHSVPTYGAIILCEENTHVLLVRHYTDRPSWGFPKGKVNEDENPAHCAIREVYEETGFDITNYIEPENYLESVINEQLVRLYVISGVPKNTKFQPRTRFEIKACEWFLIADLPNDRKDPHSKLKTGLTTNAFFMILPFMKRIKSICNNGGNAKRQRHKSSSVSEGESTNKTRSHSHSDQKINYNYIKGSNGTNDRYFQNDKKEKKSHSKRQLFNQQVEDEFVFSAPSWLNFKFDKAAIMECIP